MSDHATLGVTTQRILDRIAEGRPLTSCGDDQLQFDGSRWTDDFLEGFARDVLALLAERQQDKQRIEGLRKLAKRAKLQADAPTYDDAAVRTFLWRLVDAVLAGEGHRVEGATDA